MTLFISDSFFGFKNDKYRASLSHPKTRLIWSQNLTRQQAVLQLKKSLRMIAEPTEIVAHGKGGLDMIDCLLQFPELRSKVKKLVCVQSPIWGTPVADFLVGHPLMRVALNFSGFIFRFSPQAVEELTELNRQVYMIINRGKIMQLMSEVEIVTVGSSFDWQVKPEGLLNRIGFFVNQLIVKHAGPNDGVVPESSTRIANEKHVELRQVSHLGAIPLMPSEYPSLNPLAQTEGQNVEGPVRF